MANKRKKQLVHRDIQLALVKRLLFQWIVFVVVTGVVTLAIQYLIDPLQASDVLAQRVKLTVGSMLLVSVCLAPLFIRDSIKLSHRVVGPIVRLRSSFKQVAPNIENERINLREHDFFKEVAADYNDMLSRIERHETVDSAPSP